jgi:hypothetical protein
MNPAPSLYSKILRIIRRHGKYKKEDKFVRNKREGAG